MGLDSLRRVSIHRLGSRREYLWALSWCAVGDQTRAASRAGRTEAGHDGHAPNRRLRNRLRSMWQRSAPGVARAECSLALELAQLVEHVLVFGPQLVAHQLEGGFSAPVVAHDLVVEVQRPAELVFDNQLGDHPREIARQERVNVLRSY